MFISYIGILILFFLGIFAEPAPVIPNKSTITFKLPDKPDVTSPPTQYGASSEPCRGDDCRRSPNLVAPLVGSLCGILVVALIGVFIVWFYFKRKHRKAKEVSKTPEIKFIEQPSLYTGAISTTDSSSRLYGMTPPRNDSVSSHYYEKINYNERP